MSAFGADLALNAALFDALDTDTDAIDSAGDDAVDSNGDDALTSTGVASLLADGAEGIYTNVPQGADKPYLVIGDNELTQGNIKGCEEWIGKVTIEVRTEQADGAEPPVELAKTILAAVEAVLDDTLAVTGYDVIILSNDFTGNDVDPVDEKSVEGRLTYNIDMIAA